MVRSNTAFEATCAKNRAGALGETLIGTIDAELSSQKKSIYKKLLLECINSSRTGFANPSATFLLYQQIEIFAKLFLNVKDGVANAVLHRTPTFLTGTTFFRAQE